MISVNSIPYKTIRSAKKETMKVAEIDSKNKLIFITFYNKKVKKHLLYKFELNAYNESVVYENMPMYKINRK